MDHKTSIRLSYDILSPWSYFAYAILKRYRPLWDFDLILNPISLVGVMNASKNTPPFMVPNKLKKMAEEIPLMSKFLGVTCIAPEGPFPFNTLPIMRFLKVVKDHAPDRLEALTNNFFELVFENKVIKVTADITRIFSAISPDIMAPNTVEEYVRMSESEAVKEAVKRDADALVVQGAFGFPWIEVTRNDDHRLTIFGSDRFEFLAHWLGKEWNGPNPSIDHPKNKL